MDSLHTTHFFKIFLEVPHVYFFRSGVSSAGPSHGTVNSLSIFSLFCMKILVYLGVMKFGWYGQGTSILSLNQSLVPSLLPVTVNMARCLPSVWLLLQPWQTKILVGSVRIIELPKLGMVQNFWELLFYKDESSVFQNLLLFVWVLLYQLFYVI